MAPAASIAARHSAGRQVDDLAATQRRHQDLLEISAERLAVHWSIQHHRRGQSAKPQGAGEGRCLPMSVRNGRVAALTALGAATQASHLG